MKYKVLIIIGLMIGGLCLLSCNQLWNSQQAEEVTENEEASDEEKWDSIVIKYQTYSDIGVMVLYPDGTAAKGLEKNFKKGKLQAGYWQQGIFTRGNQEFEYLQITFSGILLNGDSHEYDYYISEDCDRVWIDDFTAMMAKNSNGYEIVSLDVM